VIDRKTFYTDLIPDQAVNTAVMKRGFSLEKMIEALCVRADFAVHMEQPHGSSLAIVDGTTFDSLSERGQIPLVDAIVTKEKRLPLIVRTADCLPILFYHPSGLIGAVHAGRKGTELGICSKVFQTVKALLSDESGPFDIWLGPSICFSCYQIDRDEDRHYNLLEENRKQILASLGDADINWHEAQQCTSCQNDQFFSYRKEGPGAGRIYSLISLS